jgi:hypothetical protein
MKGDEIGGACSINGREETSGKFYSENPRERHHFDDLGVEGMIIFK